MNHYVNTAATDVASARTVSQTILAPSPFPVMLYGDVPSHTFVFHSNGTVESWSGDASNGLRVTVGEIGAGPFGGTYALTSGSTTPALSYNANAGTLTAALNALTGITSDGGVDVSGEFPNFLIAWRTTGTKTALTVDGTDLVPDSGAVLTTLHAGDSTHTQRLALTLRRNSVSSTTTWTPVTSPARGWSGTISTNTPAALTELMYFGERVGEFLQVTTALTVERIQPDGTYQTVYQTPVVLRAKNVDLGATGSQDFASYLTSTQFLSNGVQNYSSVTGLASAIADPTKLGGIAAGTTGLPIGASVVLNFAVTVNDGGIPPTHTGTLTLIYQVQASTSNSAPLWVRPYNYANPSNAVAYRLVAASLDTLPAAYNGTTGKFHYIGAAGAANAVYPFVDQVGTAAPA